MIVQKGCRYYLLPRIPPFLHFHSNIHVNNKLELQSVIQGCQIKFFVSGLIIDHLYINMLLILKGIDPVDPSLQLHLFVL